VFRIVPLSIRKELQFRPDPARKLSANLYVLLCVQWKIPDDGQRKCPKHVEFYSKNKFEKLVYLVGFFIRIYHDTRSPERQIHVCMLAKPVETTQNYLFHIHACVCVCVRARPHYLHKVQKMRVKYEGFVFIHCLSAESSPKLVKNISAKFGFGKVFIIIIIIIIIIIMEYSTMSRNISVLNDKYYVRLRKWGYGRTW